MIIRQVLSAIDPRPFEGQPAKARADLAGARAALANADAELKRAEALVKDHLISQTQADLRNATQLQAAATPAAGEAAVSGWPRSKDDDCP